MKYASFAAFLLAVYSNYLSAAKAHPNCPFFFSFFLTQADYILGKNSKDMNYLVGYGQKYVIHVHPRGAYIALYYAAPEYMQNR